MVQVKKKELDVFLRNMRYLIRTSGYDTSNLAKMLGVNVREIQRWKKMERVPSLKNGINFARFFNKPMEGLLSKKYYKRNN